jgi:hypothetical protein
VYCDRTCLPGRFPPQRQGSSLRPVVEFDCYIDKPESLIALFRHLIIDIAERLIERSARSTDPSLVRRHVQDLSQKFDTFSVTILYWLREKLEDKKDMSVDELPTVEDIHKIHELIEQQWDLTHHGTRGVLPDQTLRSILDDIRTLDGEYRRAAAFLNRLADAHVYEDRNKRTAWTVAEIYLF